jgi:putative SOS response-associated peptidase YedK
MCGRFRIAQKKEILEEAFDLGDLTTEQNWVPRYNVAPCQEIAIVRQDAIHPARLLSHALPRLVNTPAIWEAQTSGRQVCHSRLQSFCCSLLVIFRRQELRNDLN